MKFLKTWVGTTSGSHLGRDDGYPERKFREINSIDELIADFDPRAEYYRVERIHNDTVDAFVKIARNFEVLKNETN